MRDFLSGVLKRKHARPIEALDSDEEFFREYYSFEVGHPVNFSPIPEEDVNLHCKKEDGLRQHRESDLYLALYDVFLEDFGRFFERRRVKTTGFSSSYLFGTPHITGSFLEQGGSVFNHGRLFWVSKKEEGFQCGMFTQRSLEETATDINLRMDLMRRKPVAPYEAEILDDIYDPTIPLGRTFRESEETFEQGSLVVRCEEAYDSYVLKSVALAIFQLYRKVAGYDGDDSVGPLVYLHFPEEPPRHREFTVSMHDSFSVGNQVLAQGSFASPQEIKVDYLGMKSYDREDLSMNWVRHWLPAALR